jgi:hypothetical protein
VSSAGSEAADYIASGGLSKGHSPLSHLLHALNQPLTGLQCSLELALAGRRTPEQNLQSLREGLELTGRMRILVEAIRELVDCEQEEGGERAVVELGSLFRDTVEDLRPVAEAKEIQIQLRCDALLPVRASRGQLAAVVLRFCEAALSLAERKSVFRMVARIERKDAFLNIDWSEACQAPEHSPFSRPELGLMLAQAGWKRAGAEWSSNRVERRQRVMIRLPLASGPNRL